MTIIELLSWDAFGSGWFWALLLLQLLVNSSRVIGIPVDMLRTSDIDQIGPILKWRITRLVKLVEGLHVLVISVISSAMCGILVLGFWYQIEVFAALCLLVLPEIAILRLGYRTAIKLRHDQVYSLNTIQLINGLHHKIQALGAVNLLLAGFLGYGYEVLL
jgi:hypothetical protein|tara:strand:- start:62 stop:544 length:483 start_codon:yes stop_codon:yes gene_type:complete